MTCGLYVSIDVDGLVEPVRHPNLAAWGGVKIEELADWIWLLDRELLLCFY